MDIPLAVGTGVGASRLEATGSSTLVPDGGGVGGTMIDDGTSGSVEARVLGVGVGSAECLGASGTEGAGVRGAGLSTVFCPCAGFLGMAGETASQ